jgi:hypothetical protein
VLKRLKAMPGYASPRPSFTFEQLAPEFLQWK